MSTLEVDTFTGGISREQNLNLWVVSGRFLRVHPLLAAHATVDEHNRSRSAEES